MERNEMSASAWLFLTRISMLLMSAAMLFCASCSSLTESIVSLDQPSRVQEQVVEKKGRKAVIEKQYEEKKPVVKVDWNEITGLIDDGKYEAAIQEIDEILNSSQVSSAEANRLKIKRIECLSNSGKEPEALSECRGMLIDGNLSVPPGISAVAKRLFRKTLKSLPQIQSIDVAAGTKLYPLKPGTDGKTVTFVVLVSQEAESVVLSILPLPPGSGRKQVIKTTLIKSDLGTYSADWKPSFFNAQELGNTLKSKNLTHCDALDLGKWRVECEVTGKKLLSTDKEKFIDTNVLFINARLSAPDGLKLKSEPKKPQIFRKYTSKDSIPLPNRYHIFSFIYYPILGFPRDLVDTVFGAIDKVPYVSIPVNLVYAAPGQLLCKPWWSYNYTPFREQSTGFLSWNEWKEDEWEFFENARTWYWPRNEFGQMIMGIFYLGLGFPRDVVDMPFGLIDHIPYLGMPVSYAYQPVTIVTKPWYAERYTSGAKKGERRTPYCKQSKNVVGLTEWWRESKWVFFENFKTTTFKSENYKKKLKLEKRWQSAQDKYETEYREIGKHNDKLRNSVVLSIEEIVPEDNNGNQ